MTNIKNYSGNSIQINLVMFLRYSLQVALQVALPERMRFFKYCKSWSMTNDLIAFIAMIDYHDFYYTVKD